MAVEDVSRRFVRERRRIAILAAALLAIVSAYAVGLSLASPDATPTAAARGDALLLSGVLVVVSAAGIIATARPNECMGLIRPGRRQEPLHDPEKNPDGTASFPLVAHHCSCGRFADHTVHLGGRTVCAGCLGMAAGGGCGIALAVALGAGLLFFDATAGPVLSVVGATAAAGGLVLLFRPSPPGVHAVANFAFVSGMALVAVLLSGHGLAAGALGILAAVALVGLRIEMSRWRHLSVYAGCPWPQSCRGTTALAAARRATRR